MNLHCLISNLSSEPPYASLLPKTNTQSAESNAADISSRYETEDQSEYRTDEDEVAGRHLPQTDLDEGETEMG